MGLRFASNYSSTYTTSGVSCSFVFFDMSMLSHSACVPTNRISFSVTDLSEPYKDIKVKIIHDIFTSSLHIDFEILCKIIMIIIKHSTS